MATSTPTRVQHIALVGNPNTGKSTLFNALCGMRQRVGNYPGVTVEKKLGRCEIDGVSYQIIDLPGSYSLAPRSPDEMIAVDVLLGLQPDVPRPDAVLCIVDASNLERNLYLVSQVLELNLPTVVALNMTDVAEGKGIRLDVTGLSKRLGVPVIPIQAHRRQGLSELRLAIGALPTSTPCPPRSPFPEAFQAEVARIEARTAGHGQRGLPRYLAERLLLDASGFLATCRLPGVTNELLAEVDAARARLKAAEVPIPAVEAVARYQWVGEVTEGLITRTSRDELTWTDRLDRVLTHRVYGTLMFLAIMLGMFEAVFHLGDYASGWIDRLNGFLTEMAVGRVAEGPLRSLLVDGLIAGVGGIITFLPQIFVLFFFIAVLEDCGYMARAAYLMDKLMCRVGLSGKSFIPLLSSFACAIPGIMSARVIENPRDRLITVLVAPLMSCSARFPVYTLLINAFIPDRHWLPWLPGLRSLVMFSMYLIGIVAAVGVALVLRRTLLRGPTPPFVMELPTYKMPSPPLVVHRMLDSGWSFVQRAGTLILAVSVLVWFA
ncbi:MAG: ferrous iron transport protein B, partial [Pirellulaceae bacterium]